MTTFDPLADLDGVRTYQERVMVRAVRLTRDNATAIAKIARKVVGCTDYGLIYLTGQRAWFLRRWQGRYPALWRCLRLP